MKKSEHHVKAGFDTYRRTILEWHDFIEHENGRFEIDGKDYGRLMVLHETPRWVILRAFGDFVPHPDDEEAPAIHRPAVYMLCRVNDDRSRIAIHTTAENFADDMEWRRAVAILMKWIKTDEGKIDGARNESTSA